MNDARSRDRRVGRQAAEVAEQTKREILKASLHCFATRGYKSTTLREIADRANTTHGLLRHHFGSKEKLWRACVSFVIDQTAELQLPVIAKITPENAVESFELVVRAFIQNSGKYPDMWRLLMFEALKDSERLHYILDLVWPIHEQVAPLFDMVQKQGYLRNFTNDTFFLFVVSLGAVPLAIAPFSNKLCESDILSAEELARHADLVIDTLITRSGPDT